jgi:hypothetical protein
MKPGTTTTTGNERVPGKDNELEDVQEETRPVPGKDRRKTKVMKN